MREHHRCRKIHEPYPDIENEGFSKRKRFIHAGYCAVVGDSKLWGITLILRSARNRLSRREKGRFREKSFVLLVLLVV